MQKEKVINTTIKNTELQLSLCSQLRKTKHDVQNRAEIYNQLRNLLAVNQFTKNSVNQSATRTNKRITGQQIMANRQLPIKEIIARLDQTRIYSSTWYSFAEELCNRVEQLLQNKVVGQHKFIKAGKTVA